MSLVQTRTQQILSIKTQFQRMTGQTLATNQIKLKRFKPPQIGDANVQLAMESSFIVMKALDDQIKLLEKTIIRQAECSVYFPLLKTVTGIGDIFAPVITLKTGDIARFEGPGNYASYCRCVESKRTSNGKRKGENNKKNGNKYLSRAYVEAANFAI